MWFHRPLIIEIRLAWVIRVGFGVDMGGKRNETALSFGQTA